MELRQLHTFKVVAELRGFTRAAELLGYAQSSVTAQIQSLEEEIGSPLFDRLGKKITLTEAGLRLLPYAQEILKLHTAALDLAKDHEAPSGTLVIGAPESLAAYRLPSVIKEYRQFYPQVKMVLKPGLCWEMRTKVRSGELDLAFLLEPPAAFPDLHTETLVIEKMTLVSSPDHPLASVPKMEPEQLKNETFLHTEPGCSYRSLFEKHLNQMGVYPNSDLEFWNIEAIKNCVICGLGISFLPYITVRRELEEKKLVSLNWGEMSDSVCTQLVYHRSKWLTPAMKEFLSLVQRHANEWKKAFA